MQALLLVGEGDHADAAARLAVALLAVGGGMIGGAVLTETIFSWPGVGKWLTIAIVIVSLVLMNLGRNKLRDIAMRGDIPGMIKASW